MNGTYSHYDIIVNNLEALHRWQASAFLTAGPRKDDPSKKAAARLIGPDAF